MEEKIKHRKELENYPKVQEEKLIQTILASKQALCNNSSEETISYFEFLYIQVNFIKKRWWLFQAGILILLWVYLYVTHGDFAVYRGIGILIPVFVILAIPELWKNIHSKSWEIENTAYYSLRQVYSARLLLFGGVDLLMLSIFMITSNIVMQISFYDILIQCLLPFNVTCCICFGILCGKRFSSEYIAIAFCMTGAAIWYQFVLNTELYTSLSKMILLGILALSTAFLLFTIRKLLKNCKCYGEVNLLWN
jgi:hypothetical protein